MDKWDEETFREINDMDAARLAIRGALSTIRDLQDLNTRVKGEAQEESARRKAADTRIAELGAQLERWQQEAANWEKERKEWAANEMKWRQTVRQQVRAEEGAHIEADRQRLEDELGRMKADGQQRAAAQRQKEDQWAQIKKQLDSREAELLASQREKIELASRYKQDAEIIERLRQQRDKEILASLDTREKEIEDQGRQILQLRRQNEEFQKLAAAGAKEVEIQLQEREENLFREFRLKEKALQEKYSDREAQLQSAWAELENGLWQRTKEAREKLDHSVTAQFEQKARELADRSREIETLLVTRQLEMENEFTRKCGEAEARYAHSERRLLDEWVEKERRFLRKFEEELGKEKLSLEEQLNKRAKALESDYDARHKELDRRAEDLANDHKHRVANLAEDQARKDAERIRRQDDFIARKTADLEKEHQKTLSALEEAHRNRQSEALLELNTLKMKLMADQQKAVESEKSVLKEEFDRRGRSLDQAYELKVAEAEQLRKALEEQFREWKAAAAVEHAQKESNLDKRWNVREQELIRQNEIALERQRRAFQSEAQKTKEQFDLKCIKLEEDAYQQLQALRPDFERRERQLQDTWTKREAQLHLKYEDQLREVRESYRRELEARAQLAAQELARVKTDLDGRFNLLREKAQIELSDKDRLLSDRGAQIAELRLKFSELESQKTDWMDRQTRGLAEDRERSRAETQKHIETLKNEFRFREKELGDLLREREKALNERYSAMEKELKAEKKRLGLS